MNLVSKALLRAIKEMRDAEKREVYEGAEIVYSGGQCWLGNRRLQARTLNEGLRLCLFRSEGAGSQFERHTLNEDGRGLADDPNHYIPRILRARGKHNDHPNHTPRTGNS